MLEQATQSSILLVERCPGVLQRAKADNCFMLWASRVVLYPERLQLCPQVTLAAGRSGAAAQRAAEREVRAQQRAAAKERGRRRAALVEAQRGVQGIIWRGHNSPLLRAHWWQACSR